MREILAAAGLAALFTASAGAQTGNNSAATQHALVNQYCLGCHNDKLKSGNFSWTKIDLAHPEQNPEEAEKAIICCGSA